MLLQTEWQARHKAGGLSDAAARPALARHLASYSVAFGPVLVWVGLRQGAARALTVWGLVAGPHLLIDDGRLVRAWLSRVKRARGPGPALLVAVDQSFHLLSLAAAAMVVAR